MDFIRKLIFLVFLMCALISLKKENAETRKSFPTITLSPSNLASSISRPMCLSNKLKTLQQVDDYSSGYDFYGDSSGALKYDFYYESCPDAEKIIRSRVKDLYNWHSDIVPALLCHDCFTEVKFLVLSCWYWSGFVVLSTIWLGWCFDSRICDWYWSGFRFYIHHLTRVLFVYLQLCEFLILPSWF